jgi:phosphotriesterase-related protein
MVLAHDVACYFDWADPNLLKSVLPNWHLNYIPDDILPALREAGVSDADLTTMTVDNPRRIFEMQGAY